MWEIEPRFVTFVIPTKGRPSLQKTVQSLLDLEGWDWKCIIIFDGIKPIELNDLRPSINYLNDNHFKVIQCEHKGHAGLVRNVGLPLVDTKYTAFVDDDDFLAPTYLSALKRYDIDENDIVIFTYVDMENGNTQPPKGFERIIKCNVGISFAVKTNFIRENNILFPQGGIEDFAFLDECVQKGGKYNLTHSIQYYVGHRSAWS